MPARAAFRSDPAAAPPPAVSSPMPCASPTSIRSSTRCLFERFLNPERVSLPDIDMDFCMDRRGEVINYVVEKYGKDHVAQIITFGTLGAKAAIRDVGRVLEIPYAEVDRVAKLVPNQLNITLQQALDQEPKLRELVETDTKVKELMAHRPVRSKDWPATPRLTPPVS